MAERKTTVRRRGTAVKKEMQDTYTAHLAPLEEGREAELKPEARLEQKLAREAVEAADRSAMDAVLADTGLLKTDVGRFLSEVTERMEAQIRRYETIKSAVAVKEKELAEIYEIQRAASSLTALLEAQAVRRDEFEAEMAGTRETLAAEVAARRAEWEEERRRHEAEVKARDAEVALRRRKEEDEYRYTFNREQQQARERFEDERGRLERELTLRKEQAEAEFSQRERSLAAAEGELRDLRSRAAGFPQELESVVAREVKAAVDRVTQEAAAVLRLTKKEFEGERNVLQARIEALEEKAKEQVANLTRLNQQLEKAYGQVQQIAVKAVEGSAKTPPSPPVDPGRGADK
jgi:hypothetical protein